MEVQRLARREEVRWTIGILRTENERVSDGETERNEEGENEQEKEKKAMKKKAGRRVGMCECIFM